MLIEAADSCPRRVFNTLRFHIRPEIIGEILSFDGDNFVIDFRKQK